MKKWFLTAVALTAMFLTSSGADNLARIEEDTGYIRVKNDHFACTFFPRHMFPVWFETSSGKKFPEVVRFLDRVVEAEKRKGYFLFRDLWAKQEIVENTPERFVIVCTGVYCNHGGDITAPGGLTAKYRYEITRESPDIKVTAEISRKEASPPLTVVFLQPAWYGRPFSSLEQDGKTRELDDKGNRVFGPARNMRFSTGDMEVAMRFNQNNRNIIARDRTKDGYSSLWAFYRKGWTGKRMTLTAYLSFRDASNTASGENRTGDGVTK